MSTGPRRGAWSTTELLRLRELLPRGGVAHAARYLRRPEETVRRKVRELYGSRKLRGPWTPDEDRRLRAAFGAVDLPMLALMLGRTQRQVQERVRALRRKPRVGPWTAVEDRQLKRLYGTRPDRALEVSLNRPVREIREAAARLCLGKDRKAPAARPATAVRTPRWRPEEVEALRAAYPTTENLEIARTLGRSVASVANKAYHLGLQKSPEALQEMGRRNARVGRGRSPAPSDRMLDA